MSSVLVFIKPDNDHENPSLDWQKFKCGDVIDISAKDKHHWGTSVVGPKALGWWKVVVVPDAPLARLSGVLSSDLMPYGVIDPDRTVIPHRIRIFTVDVTRLKDRMTESEFMETVSMKPEVRNPNSIGSLDIELG